MVEPKENKKLGSSDELRMKVTYMADVKRRVWTSIETVPVALLSDLSEIVAYWEEKHQGCLREVGHGPVLMLASDYSGQHSSSRFEKAGRLFKLL